MRVFCLLVLLLLGGAVAVFAVQNQEVIKLQFFDWKFVAQVQRDAMRGLITFFGIIDYTGPEAKDLLKVINGRKSHTIESAL